MNRPQPRIPATVLAGGTLLAGLVSAVVLSTTGSEAGKPFVLAVAPTSAVGEVLASPAGASAAPRRASGQVRT